MANSGEYPLDPLSDVGRFRLTFGDIASVPLSPVEDGYQDYTNFSDLDVIQFLYIGGDSVARAVGYAYLQASGAAGLQSKTIKDYDLSVDLSKRAEDLRRTAQFYFDLADNADLIAGVDEDFIIADTGNDRDLDDTTEGAPPYFPVDDPWPWGNG